MKQIKTLIIITVSIITLVLTKQATAQNQTEFFILNSENKVESGKNLTIKITPKQNIKTPFDINFKITDQNNTKTVIENTDTIYKIEQPNLFKTFYLYENNQPGTYNITLSVKQNNTTLETLKQTFQIAKTNTTQHNLTKPNKYSQQINPQLKVLLCITLFILLTALIYQHTKQIIKKYRLNKTKNLK